MVQRLKQHQLVVMGRSEALSMLIIDEGDSSKVLMRYGSAQSTLSTGGKAIVLSTPNGVGNFFHKTG